MLRVIKKYIGKVVAKATPYWCKYCPKRFSKKKSFINHYLHCESRLMVKDKQLRESAPVNRGQRRRMAKRAGQIKDWDRLNAP